MLHIHRDALQGLAKARFEDAELLYAKRRHGSSYYFYGLCVELGLKSKIALLFPGQIIPDMKLVRETHTHEIRKLVDIAGLATEILELRRADASADFRWTILEKWTPECRYETIDAVRAAAMRDAVAEPTNGIFQWLIQNW
jgi:hypothetical protein